ncbi:MAG TPA: hypothetical protein VIQ24_16105 [Pyrinomonadaceae bacterium]
MLTPGGAVADGDARRYGGVRQAGKTARKPLAAKGGLRFAVSGAAHAGGRRRFE